MPRGRRKPVDEMENTPARVENTVPNIVTPPSRRVENWIVTVYYNEIGDQWSDPSMDRRNVQVIGAKDKLQAINSADSARNGLVIHDKVAGRSVIIPPHRILQIIIQQVGDGT